MSNRELTQPQSIQRVATKAPAPQQAVQEYLDALLQDATAQAELQPVETVVVETAVAEAEKVETEIAVEEAVETTLETIVEPVVKSPDPVLAEPQVVEVSEPTAEVVAAERSRAWKEGRPGWAQEAFECLLFKVAGLTLAVPLVELGGVLTMQEDLNPLFGQPEWFLGLLPSKTAGTVKTIDTARWVMPEKYTDETRQGLKYVILMEGTDWGMACHEVAEAVTLQPDQVRWRGERSQRPWLAGTVIEHMCAIMDVAALVDLLSEDSLKIKAPQWTRHYPSAT